jgi:multidrug efflux pump subunit AcrA (membrane-fusion protein)
MLKNKWFWIIALVLILAVGGGAYYYYTTQVAASEQTTAQEPALQTAVARRGDLVVSASGSGQLVPSAQIQVGFEDSGTLIELNVSEGDQVKAGDVLARLQNKSSPEEIAAAISDAELNVLRAQQTIDDLYASADASRATAMSNVATYEQQVRDAQYQLENYSIPSFLQGMDTVEAVTRMKERLDEASKAFAPYKYYPQDDQTRQALLEGLNEAQSNYDAAVKRLNYEYALQVAQANLNKARQEYEKYQNGPAASELELAQAELENARAKLVIAQKTQAVIDLIAPRDATVMAVDANVGETISATPIITLADLEYPLLEVYLDETDLDKATVGNEAEIVFDALPDLTFKGKVVTVSPGLATVSNTQAVKVLVALDLIDQDINLPVGLNASVDIIAGRATNAVLVPVEALRELGPGEYAVFVEENGELTMRVVQVGLKDVTSAEIISGLEAGETVSTGIVQSK